MNLLPPEFQDGIHISKDMMQAIEKYDTFEVSAFMRRIMPAMVNLFESKDINYGGSWQKRGILSAQMNFERKIDRINAQFYGGTITSASNENIADTFVDAAVYELMYLFFLAYKNPMIKKQVDDFISQNTKYADTPGGLPNNTAL
jgi:hypothetical protein